MKKVGKKLDKKEALLRERRKDEHVTLALKNYERTEYVFRDLQILGTSLPRLDVKDVSLQTQFAGHTFDVPFYINAMTGGSAHTKNINQDLAEIAREVGLAMAVGSQSAALSNPDLIPTYEIVRKTHPNGILFANVSPEISVDQAKFAIDMLEANILQIHINPAQELVMREGDRNFAHWAEAIKKYTEQINIPIIVKEVGFGMRFETVQLLKDLGVQTVDLGGRGGTNFAEIENDRRRDQGYNFMQEWGLTTAESLLDAKRQVLSGTEFIASGGIKTPLDMMKCFILGAKAAGIAGLVLHSLKKEGKEATIQKLTLFKENLQALFVLVDAKNMQEVSNTPLIVKGDLQNFCVARGIDFQKLAK